MPYREAVRSVADRGEAAFEVRGSTFIGHLGTAWGVLESAGVTFDAVSEKTVRFDVRVPTDTADGLPDGLRSATAGRLSLRGRDP